MRWRACFVWLMVMETLDAITSIIAWVGYQAHERNPVIIWNLHAGGIPLFIGFKLLGMVLIGGVVFGYVHLPLRPWHWRALQYTLAIYASYMTVVVLYTMVNIAHRLV